MIVGKFLLEEFVWQFLSVFVCLTGKSVTCVLVCFIEVSNVSQVALQRLDVSINKYPKLAESHKLQNKTC